MKKIETNNTKQNYYIFLDIDGTLWDAIHNYFLIIDESLKKTIALDLNDPLRGYEEIKLWKESVNAVNTLIENLSPQFDLKLVITSKRRSNLPKCINYLKINGLKYDGPIFCTRLKGGKRGQKIIDFLAESNNQPLTYPTKRFWLEKLLYSFYNRDFKNYVVIDDELSPLKDFIPPKRRIITNHDSEALTTKQVKKYLSKNNLLIKNNQPEKN